jgi:hypothetical protein
MKSNSGSWSFCSNLVFLLVLSVLFSFRVFGQNAELFTISGENLRDGKSVALDLNLWKFRLGDEAVWAARDLDESGWQHVGDSKTTPEKLVTSPEWNGRVWFRLRVRVDESAANRRLVLIAGQTGGASEVFLNGKLIARYGEIGEKIVEYNPNGLPIPFEFDRAGEHTFAVRFASRSFAEIDSGAGGWLVFGKVFPNFTAQVKDAENLTGVIGSYANAVSMRGGFLFAGDLLALYSDGVTEAYDEQENEWGDENLLMCLKTDFHLSAENLTAKVVDKIDEFAQTAPQHDDITIFILKRL